ncbi:hypothetical protein MPTK1_6g14120 [Marchantia polymorpha subsp. ruderalis]|uniref:Uncharacterized protein n=2 Tax=Marchantia polymorpha TaxID=3197 RepID=A0AAF6BRV9_MARPO|nr:hypothetical protein MARPO_0047s0066 [Marchantia polymorpha]BBN14743.1 hypothetical protein Mp_6g14120 [Marchantia polymorpha subsp. ruderalis]|eukprot:PTQ39086.1 hypothetical protein MARPO_0047s0066 [Marchantia polymorpha]
MSGGSEDSHIYSDREGFTIIGNRLKFALTDSKDQSTETVKLEEVNIYGGQTVKASVYEKSGTVQILKSYTIIEYDEKGIPKSRNSFDSKGRPIRR